PAIILDSASHPANASSRSSCLPVILDLTVREVFIDLARMHAAAVTHEIQQQLSPLAPRRRPGQSVLSWHAAIRPWMHKRLKFPRDESVIDEKVFLDAELRVSTFQVACAVVLHAMTQDEILSPGGCANRVGLRKLHPMPRPLQGGGGKQALRNEKPPQVVGRNGHQEILPNPTHWKR